MQAADLEKDCNSFTVCVAISMFVLGLWEIIFPSFFLLRNRSIEFMLCMVVACMHIYKQVLVVKLV